MFCPSLPARLSRAGLVLTLLVLPHRCWSEAVPVSAVEPATVIGETSPANWSHMVVKSQSKVGAGDVPKVPAKDVRMANKFNTVFLANVRPDGVGQFRLAKLGVGCTVNVHGKDTVIDPETQREIGANLGFFEGILLKAICKRQAKVLLIGHLPTIGIVDVPAAVRWNRVNRQMTIRYGLLVDAQTGDLQPLVWLLDPAVKSAEDAMVSNIQSLPPNCIDNCTLFVDADEYRFGKLPSDVAYAVTSIPRGTMELIPTKETRSLLGQPSYTPQEVSNVERHLRTLHSQPTAQRHPVDR